MRWRPGDKVELHCHADGLGRPGPAETPLAWMLPQIAGHVEAWAAEQVVYAELMVSRLLYDDAAPERFQAVREAVDRAAAGRLRVELLACIGRGPRARAERQSTRILRLAQGGLIGGVAIAGDETACTIASVADLVAAWREAGLGIEIHAGEQAGPESVRDALEHGRPQRLGHGVRAFEDDRLIADLAERRVHLEFCPTSNLRLGVVGRLADHPITRARALGLSYGVSTDDPGPFECTLTSELDLLQRELGFDERDLETLRANAWSARFGR